MLSKYRHVIWDWNGTLLDDVQLTVDILNRELAKAQKDSVDLKFFRSNIQFPIDKFYVSIGFDEYSTRRQAMRNWLDAYDLLQHGCALQPAASQILASVKNACKTQSILSAHLEQSLIEGVRRRDLEGYFSKIVGATPELTGKSKLQCGHELLTYLQAECGIPQHAIVLIGDSTHDFEVAQSLQIDCVLLSRGHMDLKRLQATGATVISSLDELLVTSADTAAAA